jgi:CheY-like chemotaxis protein
MDFSNIVNMLNEFIPSDIAGIDPLYIAGGAIVLLLLVWIVIKNRKKAPTRELVDLMPDTVDEESSEETAESDSHVSGDAVDETDGFMPAELPEEAEESLAEVESPAVEEVSSDEPVVKEDAPVEVPVQEAVEEPVRKVSDYVRKKRESTRGGRKIAKSDFSDFSGQRILIAEDNLINQKVLNGVLNESGIDVVMADDGQFVMDILEKDIDFEIILMDAHMPRVDGFEATRMIRANPAYDHIAVIALSGDTAADDVRHMKEAGMEECLEKPLKMDALYDVMSMYYSLNEADEETSNEVEQVKELEIDVDIDDLASLDYDLGLQICGDDEGMYKTLLKEFFIGYKDSSKKLHEALVKKDYAEARSILIDVKGTASNLGAKQFLHIADRFLEALSEGNSSVYATLFKDYQKYLLTLLKSIQNAFKV